MTASAHRFLVMRAADDRIVAICLLEEWSSAGDICRTACANWTYLLYDCVQSKIALAGNSREKSSTPVVLLDSGVDEIPGRWADAGLGARLKLPRTTAPVPPVLLQASQESDSPHTAAHRFQGPSTLSLCSTADKIYDEVAKAAWCTHVGFGFAPHRDFLRTKQPQTLVDRQTCATPRCDILCEGLVEQKLDE